MARHPFLDPVNPSRGELLSDADPQTNGIVEMADGSLLHFPSGNRRPIPLTTARTSGTAATRDAQAYDSYGAAPEGPKELTRVRKTT